MQYVEESIVTRVPYQKVWQAWEQIYKQREKSAPLKKGSSSSIVVNSKGKARFKIGEVKRNESIEVIWGNFFAKVVFLYGVTPQKRSSLITCRVQFKGIFAFLIKLFIGRKMKKQIASYLDQFVRQLESYA